MSSSTAPVQNLFHGAFVMLRCRFLGLVEKHEAGSTTLTACLGMTMGALRGREEQKRKEQLASSGWQVVLADCHLPIVLVAAVDS